MCGCLCASVKRKECFKRVLDASSLKTSSLHAKKTQQASVESNLITFSKRCTCMKKYVSEMGVQAIMITARDVDDDNMLVQRLNGTLLRK